MKKALSLVFAAVMLLSLAGCSLFSSKSVVKLGDYTHRDPIGVFYDKRIVLKGARFGNTLEQYYNEDAYPDTTVYDDDGNPIGMYDYDAETGKASGWTSITDGTHTDFEAGKEVDLGKPDQSKMISIPGDVTLYFVLYGDVDMAVHSFMYIIMSDASAKETVVKALDEVYGVELDEKSDTILYAEQDMEAIESDIKTAKEDGFESDSEGIDVFAEVLEQYYGVHEYKGEQAYKPYAKREDPKEVSFDAFVVLAGPGDQAVTEDYIDCVTSMTAILYAKDGNVVGQRIYYECPSKDAADKLMSGADDFIFNATRESDTVILGEVIGKEMDDLVTAYMGYNVLKDQSIGEYTRMVEETYFLSVVDSYNQSEAG